MLALGAKFPFPPLHEPPVAIVTEPLSCADALFAHFTWSAPAFAVGEGLKKMVTVLETGLQLPLPVLVSVSVTEPLEISPAVAVYEAVSEVLFGTKDPPPPLQIPPVAIVTEPLRLAVALFEQTVMFDPGLTIGDGLNEMFIVVLTGKQFPFPVVVRVSVI